MFEELLEKKKKVENTNSNKKTERKPLWEQTLEPEFDNECDCECDDHDCFGDEGCDECDCHDDEW